MPGNFSIKTEAFEGPLELLLDLIEKRKLLINDISLAAVTDDYIAYVRNLQESHMVETSQFVLIASTLLLIKSKSLLPVLDLTTEEEASVHDLEKRLRLYQLYRNRAEDLAALFGTSPLFARTYVPDERPIFTTDKYTTPEALLTALSEVVRRFPKIVWKPKVSVQKIISLDEMIKRVEERITRQISLSFKDFVASTERSNVIVGFLAVLELVKQGSVLVRQEARFHDIMIERGDIDTPRYS